MRPNAEPLSHSMPRAEIDLRARSERLRLEQLERLHTPRSPGLGLGLRRVVADFGVALFAGRARASRTRRPAADRPPSGTPDIFQLWPAACTVSCRAPVAAVRRRAAG